jgi:hypothetical protein
MISGTPAAGARLAPAPIMKLRRASARAPLDGLARIEYRGHTHCFRVADVSLGGIGVDGDASAFRVGGLVRVIITQATGKRLDTCPRLETWAVVRRMGPDRLGLAWAASNPGGVEQIIYLVDDAARAARESA